MDSTTPFAGLDLPLDAPWVCDLTRLSVHLAALVDHRKPRGVRYPLVPLLLIALLAKLAGSSRLSEIADWAQFRAAELTQLFGLRRTRMPHPTTWSRLFGHAVDPAEVTRCVRQFFAEVASTTRDPERGRVVVAIDGKTLRGTIPLGHSSGVHLLAAYRPDSGVVLAQVAVEQKANEIVAMPRLVAQLDLHGVVVVGDAMQTQRALSRQIIAGGGDYLWLVKENQPALLADIEQVFRPLDTLPGTSDEPSDFSSAQTVDKGHGRREERVLTVSSLLAGDTDWPALAQVFKLERTVVDGLGRGSTEVRYGVTSLPAEVASARRLLTVARAEWSIENDLHYRRDVTLHEDASQVRRGQAPELMAVLNNTVIGLMHLSHRSNLAAFQRECAYRLGQLLAHPPRS